MTVGVLVVAFAQSFAVRTPFGPISPVSAALKHSCARVSQDPTLERLRYSDDETLETGRRCANVTVLSDFPELAYRCRCSGSCWPGQRARSARASCSATSSSSTACLSTPGAPGRGWRGSAGRRCTSVTSARGSTSSGRSSPRHRGWRYLTPLARFVTSIAALRRACPRASG